MLVILDTVPCTRWVLNVKMPFFQVATLEFRHGAGARIQGLDLILGHSGLSIRAGSWPKPTASYPSLAVYFHLLLP